jgi:hypothetical protein
MKAKKIMALKKMLLFFLSVACIAALSLAFHVLAAENTAE